MEGGEDGNGHKKVFQKEIFSKIFGPKICIVSKFVCVKLNCPIFVDPKWMRMRVAIARVEQKPQSKAPTESFSCVFSFCACFSRLDEDDGAGDG